MQRSSSNSKITVIAHRGASGYLPEHTLESAAMAHAWNVDYIEPDVVMTKDNQLVVIHDIMLDSTTDVAEKYPHKKRKDGHYYAIDFTLKQIKRLNVHERTRHGSSKPYFPNRFPNGQAQFEVPTLNEFIELVQGLNRSTGRNVGIYPEIKKPEFHLKHKKDITKALIKTLKTYGYDHPKAKVIIQCFWPQTLMRLKTEFKTSIPLMQLIADNSWKESSANYSEMLTEQGLKQVATYADGIAPWLKQLVTEEPSGKGYQLTSLAKWARKNNLRIHPYTHRTDQLPKFIKSEQQFFDILFKEIQVDGVFSDFADRVVVYKGNH